jgi:hypothetical protein
VNHGNYQGKSSYGSFVVYLLFAPPWSWALNSRGKKCHDQRSAAADRTASSYLVWSRDLDGPAAAVETVLFRIATDNIYAAPLSQGPALVHAGRRASV